MDTTQVSDLTNLNEKAGESSRKIRVLYLINQLVIGGATNVVLDLAGYFHQHPDFEVHLVTGSQSEGRSDVTHLATDQGIRTIMVPSLVNHISPLTNLRSILDLRKVIVQGKYDIVHTHTKVPGVLGRIAALMANTDLIVHHVHGWGAAEGMSRAVRMLHIGLERFCARFTDRIIVVAKPEIEKALNFKIGRKDKFSLIYNGVNVEAFQQPVDEQKLRSGLGLKPKTKLIGMIGRLEPQKNPMDFIRAAAIVTQNYDKAQFLIVGGGPLKAECEELIKELNLEGKFFLLGFRNDVASILQILTMTAMSSLWEGLPIAFLESMSAGKPIVANDVDGARDVVIDGETGFLVPPHKPEIMAEKILRLLRDDSMCSQMGKTAQQRAGNYSKAGMLKNMEELYEELLTQDLA